MTRVIVSEDCGNSPKNILIQNLTTAFAKGDVKFILGNITDDILWHIIGKKTIKGRNDFVKALGRKTNNKVRELTISHVITHGKAGAINGILKMTNGETCSFCDVYEFNGAKGTSVKGITSYVIEIK